RAVAAAGTAGVAPARRPVEEVLPEWRRHAAVDVAAEVDVRRVVARAVRLAEHRLHAGLAAGGAGDAGSPRAGVWSRVGIVTLSIAHVRPPLRDTGGPSRELPCEIACDPHAVGDQTIAAPPRLRRGFRYSYAIDRRAASSTPSGDAPCT